MCVPGQIPAFVASVDTCQCFRELVARGRSDTEVETTVAGELVGLVKDNQLVGRHRFFCQSGEDFLASKRVDADDYPVAVRTGEWVPVLGVLPGDNPKR